MGEVERPGEAGDSDSELNEGDLSQDTERRPVSLLLLLYSSVVSSPAAAAGAERELMAVPAKAWTNMQESRSTDEECIMIVVGLRMI